MPARRYSLTRSRPRRRRRQPATKHRGTHRVIQLIRERVVADCHSPAFGTVDITGRPARQVRLAPIPFVAPIPFELGGWEQSPWHGGFPVMQKLFPPGFVAIQEL